jgi:hypothetical protein
MGWGWSDVVDVVSDPVPDVVKDAVEDATEAAADVGAEVWEAAEDASGDLGGWFDDWGPSVLESTGWFEDIGSTIEDIGSAIDDGLPTMKDVFTEAGGDVLGTLDRGGVFDTIKTATGGTIDVSYDPEEGLGVNVGIDGMEAGMRVGAGGVSGEIDTTVFSAEGSYSDEGVELGGSAGIDYGPLPNVEGGVSIDEEGRVGVEGRVEAYIPTGGGMAGGEAGGKFQQTPEGVEVAGEVAGRYYSATGGSVEAEVHASYERDAEGSHTNVGASAEGEIYGVGGSAGVDVTSGPDGLSVTGDVDVDTDIDARDLLDIAGDALGVDVPDDVLDVGLPGDVDDLLGAAGDALGVELPEIPEGVDDVLGVAGDALGVEMPEGIEGLGAVEEALADTASADEVGGVLEDALGSALDELSVPAPVEEMVEVSVEETVEYIEPASVEAPVEPVAEETTFVE